MKRLITIIFILSVMIGMLSAQIANFPFTERFEGTTFPPAGWSIDGGDNKGNNWRRSTFAGDVIAGLGSALSSNYTPLDSFVDPNNWLISPSIALPAGPGVTLRWEARRTGGAANQNYSVYVSTSTSNTSDFTSVWTGIVSTDLDPRSIDLSSYAGNTIFIAFRHHDSTALPFFGESSFVIDNIDLSLVIENDLEAQTITGPTTGAIDTAVEFSVSIRNNGTTPIAAGSYSVKLMNEGTASDTELASVSGLAIAAGATQSHTISWTPTASGTYDLFGMVDFSADQNLANNKTSTMEFVVPIEGISTVTVGDPNSSSYVLQSVFLFNQETSLTQTIYLASDIGMTGTITHISYRFRGEGNVRENATFRVYAGMTDVDEFPVEYTGSGGPYIPFENFTEVYDGTLAFSEAGERDVYIVFDTPFNYTGGNLVLMTHRYGDNTFYGFTGNTFQVTSTPGTSRTLYTTTASWQPPINPSAVISWTESRTDFANVTLHFVSGSLGSLTGTVTCGFYGTPLEEVEIRLNGTPRRVYTNALGVYEIDSIPVGTVSITAIKDMYLNQDIEDIVIVANQPTVQDIVMEITGHDFRAVRLTGPTMPSEQQEANYRFTVRNDSALPANGYTLRLMRVVAGGDDVVVSSIAGTGLAAGETKTYTLGWSPPSTATAQIYGHVLYDLCPNKENHSTNTLTVTPQPFGTARAYVGNPNSTNWQDHPVISFNFQTAVSQTIYLEEELAIYGAITQVRFRFDGRAVPGPARFQLFAGLTDLTVHRENVPDNLHISADWLPVNQRTLVFDGEIDVAGYGERDIIIDFIEPFPYSGGNLMLLAHAPEDPARWQFGGFWHSTTGAPRGKSMRQVGLDAFDMNNIMPGVMDLTFHPNTDFRFVTAGLGSLSGIVRHGGNPLSNAEVMVNGTHIRRTTGADGTFHIPLIIEGTYSLTVIRHGYFDKVVTDVVIVDGQPTNEIIDLDRRPVVSVSGSVLAHDTAQGLAGASIHLQGYENYDFTVTGADGTYTVPEVYANFTYVLSAMKDGYVTHTREVEVGAVDVVVPPITLRERPLRPTNVVATYDDDVVNLTWSNPSETSGWISQTDDTMGLNGVGPMYTNTFSIAHRFTEEQVLRMGLRNANLTKIAFAVAEPSAFYALRVWSGGSGEPLNAGNLIYKGETMSGYDIDIWNWCEVDLFAPVAIPPSGELWIGYEVVSFTVGFPAIIGVNVNNYKLGDLICIDNEWAALVDLNPNFTNNFLVRGYVESAEGETLMLSSSIPSYESTERINAFPTVRSRENTLFQSRNITVSGARGSWDHSLARTRISNPSNDDRALVNYNIWRVNEHTMFDISTWQIIEPGISGNSYSDTSWTEVQTGEFRYIVEAVYSNNNVSSPAYSNFVYKNMISEVNITLHTFDNGPVNGAIVRLVHNNGNPLHVYQQVASHNVVTFPGVWHGNYTLTVEKEGDRKSVV